MAKIDLRKILQWYHPDIFWCFWTFSGLILAPAFPTAAHAEKRPSGAYVPLLAIYFSSWSRGTAHASRRGRTSHQRGYKGFYRRSSVQPLPAWQNRGPLSCPLFKVYSMNYNKSRKIWTNVLIKKNKLLLRWFLKRYHFIFLEWLNFNRFEKWEIKN